MFYDIYYFNDYLLFFIQKNFSHSSDPILQKPDWNHLLSICRNPVVLWAFFQISIANVFASFCFGKRIISTIAEYIAHCAVKSGNIRIRTDKPPNLRVIIPVLQIVHSGFFIVVVASVAERVGFSDGAGFAAGDAHDFSPAVILVFYYSLSGVVNQCNDIILQ